MNTTRIVACASLVGMGCRPVVGAGEAGESSTTSGSTDTTSTGPVVEPASSSTGGVEHGDIGECPSGHDGCHCDEQDACDEGLLCDGNLCRPNPNCGDGNLDAGEQCDDGNNNSNDGCTSACLWERHCFVGQLGDGRGTLRTISVATDGRLTVEGDRILAPHQPAPPGLGRATAPCGRVLAHASYALPNVAVLGPFATLPSGTKLEPLDAVFEVACTADSLFVTHQPDADLRVSHYWLGNSASPPAGTLDPLGGGLPRMFVDPSAGELYLAVSGPVTTLHRAPYTSESVGPAELLGEVPLTDADDLLLLPAAGVLVIPSGRVDGKTGLFSLAGAPASTVEGALADRTNVVALPRAGANVIALGGPSGVVVGSVSDGAFTQYGQTLLPDVADTFVRTVMDGTVLVVGDRAGLRTLETPNELDAPWTELDHLDFEGGTAMESGALVPCP